MSETTSGIQFLQRSAAAHPTRLITHLTTSRFFGGPERQMLGLAQSLPSPFSSAFVSFREGGLCEAFLEEVRRAGYPGVALNKDTPHLFAAFKELSGVLRRLGTRVLCCHGYKANLLGMLVGRRLGIPTIAVSRGWTGESLRVRLYEALDRRIMRWMDKVVCVSLAQAQKVRRAGVRDDRITVVRNAVSPERFADPDPAYADRLSSMFSQRPAMIVGAAGRLSPEKGFDVLIDAAAQVIAACGEGSSSSPGFVLFGEGPMREALARKIDERGLVGKFVLAGHHKDLDCYIPHLDLFVQSSFTEGLPNVILEAQAASVPVVATSVGGTPEVIEDGLTGWLVPPGDAALLSRSVLSALSDPAARERRGRAGRARIEEQFSYRAQAQSYAQVFRKLGGDLTDVDPVEVCPSVL